MGNNNRSFFKIEKPSHGSPEWLAVRWKDLEGNSRVSASAAAAVHNEHEFNSSGQLAADLLSPTPPQPLPANSAMERGNRLEPVILQWASDILKTNIQLPEEMFGYNEGEARLIATLDGMMEGNIPVEIKTTRKRWNGTLPRYWYWQGVQQAICAEADKIQWVIFDGDLQLHFYTQNVSSDEKQIHIDACKEFLADINLGITPINAVLDLPQIEQMYPSAKGTSVEIDEETEIAIHKLAQLRADIRDLSKQETEAKAFIGSKLGDHSYGQVNGTTLVTWNNQSRNSLDQKALEKDHPALIQKYKKTSNYRVMKTQGE